MTYDGYATDRINWVVPLTVAELDRIKRAANAEDRTQEGWMRRVILDALERFESGD